ncbi:unnamed protein product [Leptidea sinapis]|uniref:Uncharacterized protein n=1 Tax=Leptidea sinapis TaxID=189913 RepID=A0A5E4QWR7_9NEOP|nr:unnamed protein product [Leptidea sinapis]
METDLPKSALAYYVRLYCKKRNSHKSSEKHHHLQEEATKSWIKLDPSEKQYFIEKYDEYQNNVKSFANKLRSAVPYLKEKHIDNQNVTAINTLTECRHHTTINDSIASSHDVNCEITQDEQHHESNENFNENQANLTSQLRNLQESIYSALEPTPPKIMTGQQLFEIIQENSENPVTWKTLSEIISTAKR